MYGRKLFSWRCLGQVKRLAFPEDILLAFLDLVDIGLELLVIPYGNGLPVCGIPVYLVEVMVFAKNGTLARFEQGFQYKFLILNSR